MGWSMCNSSYVLSAVRLRSWRRQGVEHLTLEAGDFQYQGNTYSWTHMRTKSISDTGRKKRNLHAKRCPGQENDLNWTMEIIGDYVVP